MGSRLHVLPRLRWIVGVLCWTVTALGAPGSHQDKLRVEYGAPSDCPTRAEFETQISMRLPNVLLGQEGGSDRVLSVEVDSSGVTWRARLELRDQPGQTMSRTVTASSCDAAVEAIALATALLLEPGLPNEAEPRERSAPAKTTPRQTQPTAVPARQPGNIRRAQPTRASSVHPELGASVGFISGLGPTLAYGATLFGGWSLDASLIRVGVVLAQTPFADTDVDGVRLRQRLLAAKLEHCPYQLALGRSTRLDFCASVAAGILVSDGEGTSEAGVSGKGSHAFWLMLGLTPKLRQIWDGFFLEFEPSGFVPVTRRRFEVTAAGGAGELAFRTPIGIFGAAIGIGTEFQ